MVSIDEIHSDVTIGSNKTAASNSAEEPEEILLDEIREVVRQLLAEEYQRVARVSVNDNGWRG